MNKPNVFRNMARIYRKTNRQCSAFFVTLLGILALVSPTGAAEPRGAIDYQRLERLLDLKFPPALSGIQCHGTAMAVTDVLSIIMPLNIDEAYFSGACFQNVASPQAGDYGMFVYESIHAVLHTFTVVNEHQIFQKADPGWDKNPWEVVSVTSLAEIGRYFNNYQDTELRWARYSPSANCILKQTQDWINSRRTDSIWGPFIVDQEGYLSGTPTTSTSMQYFAVLSAMDHLNPDAMVPPRNTVPEVILHALHEYLIRPEFKRYWAPFLSRRSARYQEILTSLNKGVQTVIPESSLARAMSHATATFDFNNIAIFDNSHSGYLKIPEEYPFPSFQTFDATKFNRSQDHFQIETKSSGYDLHFYVHVKGDSDVWSFQFTR